MYLVATGTGQRIRSMHTRLPMNERPALVALQAHTVLCLPGFCTQTREGYQPPRFLTFRYDFQVLFTGPMAGFTAICSHGCASVG